MLKTPFYIRLPGLGKVIDTIIPIPHGISFEDLHLEVGVDGTVSCNQSILDKIGIANSVNIGDMGQQAFIAHWYHTHLQAGGLPINNYIQLKPFLDIGLGYLGYPEGNGFDSLNLRIEDDEIDNYHDANVRFNIDLLNEIRKLNELPEEESDEEILGKLIGDEIARGGQVDEGMKELIDFWAMVNNSSRY